MRLLFSLAAISAVSLYAGEFAELSPAAAYTYEYGFSDYHFVDPDRPWHVEARGRYVAPAKFENSHRGHTHYADADAAIYFTQFFNDENSLTYELGYDYLRFNWKRNPRFSQTNFHNLVASLGYVSTKLERWKWIINGGFSIDAAHLNFDKTGVAHAMLWGRYHFSECCGVHVGMLGWYGMREGRGWPILGLDWTIREKWNVNVIFPIDYSLSYAFTDNWSLGAAYVVFGGPYKYPRRAYNNKHGHRDPIFSVHSKGALLVLKYKFEHLLKISLGGGWNFGGWIYIKNNHNHNGKYYHYKSAPFVQANAEMTF